MAEAVVTQVERDAAFMELAYEEARKGAAEGGIPIGAVLTREDEVWGRGHNRRVQHGDAMAHGEIDCFTQAGRRKSYEGTTLYSSMAPCFLCSGAIVTMGVPRVVAVGFDQSHSKAFLEEHGVEVVNFEHDGCASIIADYAVRERETWLEDIGGYGRSIGRW